MDYFLFFAYLLFFCWLVTKISFFTNSGAEKKIIIVLFLLKVLAGLVYGWIQFNVYPTPNDTVTFHSDGIFEYHLLFNNPAEYFRNFYHNPYLNGYARVFDTEDSFWNDLRSNLIVKILSIFNIFSHCNYYINSVFYNFIVFFGAFSFFRVFADIYPDKKKFIYLTTFLLPSLLFFTSGIHRDGLVYLGLGLVVYHCYYIFRYNQLYFYRIGMIVLGLLIILLLRNFVFLTLCPALFAWGLAEKYKPYAGRIFFATYFSLMLLFFNIGLLSPRLNFPEYVSERQIAFQQMATTSSSIHLNPLYPNFRSFLNNSPQALNHSLMRPYLGEDGKKVYILPSIEIFIYDILFLLFILYRKKEVTIDGFQYFCIFFSLSILMEIGYTIPIVSPLIRYRCIYFPFLLTPVICNIEWRRIGAQFHIIKKHI